MKPAQIDVIYTELAQAVNKAGSKSELFLAMLSLKLLSSTEPAAARQAIAQVLQDLERHDGL